MYNLSTLHTYSNQYKQVLECRNALLVDGVLVGFTVINFRERKRVVVGDTVERSPGENYYLQAIVLEI
jgi:hypothetical protein